MMEEQFGLDVRSLAGFSVNAKEAAQGAAVIADGLAGGRYDTLVAHLEIRLALGSLFVGIFIPFLRSRLCSRLILWTWLSLANGT